jgi:hypothetical protein
MIPWFYLPRYEGNEAYGGNKKQMKEANKLRSGNELNTKEES